MLSINTNLSSLIAQGSMKQSTNKLNQAIERMTTGFKINHAKDNAANYSISTNMTTKIGAYNVAEDNAAMGLDLISTAEGTLDQIEDKLQRLRALAEQASNGTYGEQSLNAINAEANALVDEIERIYNNSEYNGINLMKGRAVGTEESKFIKDIDRRDTSKMTTLASVDETQKLEYGTYSISTAEELAKLATMTNNGLIGADTEFVLANDIDLSGYSNWTPIGTICVEGGVTNYEKLAFYGNFDGNGYKVTNLKIDTSNYFAGLFGVVNSSTLSNLEIDNVVINQSGNYAASLVALADNSIIDNCSASNVSITGNDDLGGLTSCLNMTTMENCYAADIEITGCNFLGGLTAEARAGCYIEKCYAKGSIIGTSIAAGGLIGVAGWCGQQEKLVIKNSYAEVDLQQGFWAGGFIGEYRSDLEIMNCYASGEIGYGSTIHASAGFIGGARNTNNLEINLLIKDSLALGSAYIDNNTSSEGIFVGDVDSKCNVTIEDCGYSSDYAASSLNLVASGGNVTVGNTVVTDTTPFTIQNESSITDYNSDVKLQVGVNASSISQISLDTSYLLDSLSLLRKIGTGSGDYLSKIDKMLAKVSEKQTMFGATSNRLESVLEEITIQRDNLVSSRSTIRDADIAEVSSHYIQQQILQQASATLMATANQSPAIALQLI